LKGPESWGWLPPPLINEGAKVQTDWLHNFLLDPFPIRPGVVLRMPKFNMSPQEATMLVNYFAARDSAPYPYSYSSRQRTEHLQQAEAEYLDKLEDAQIQVEGSRLELALNVVTNPNYCVQCHIVGDFIPTKEERGKGPDLSQVYKRLRPDYVRNYVAQPTVYLPYTGMPVNIKYDPALPFTGSLVPQELFPGDSMDQLEGLIDFLMNYDEFAVEQNQITPRVREQQQRAQELQPEGETPPTTPEPEAPRAEAE
jgi:cbb3-type cytochrome oxidase cytochrome c subunit